MRKKAFATLLSFCTYTFLIAQTIKVQPYLQDVSPHSVFILWETDTSDESIVEWGLTDTLGNTSFGSAQNSVGGARIHEVQLETLTRFTQFFL